MECIECRFCNLGAYHSGKWYCNNPKISIFRLPPDIEECFEKVERKAIADNLRYLLDEKHLSQRELAEKSGITEVTVSRYINGTRIPNGNTVVKLSDALECSCDDILKGKR